MLHPFYLGKWTENWCWAGVPKMDVHWTSIFGQPQKLMLNQPPHGRGEGGGRALWSRVTSQAEWTLVSHIHVAAILRISPIAAIAVFCTNVPTQV